MTNKEAIDIIKTAIAQVEWDYPMDYAAAFDKAVEALKEQEAVEPYMDYDGEDIWRCGKCGNLLMYLSYNESDKDAKNYIRYCSHCEKKVKWDEDGQVNQSPAGLGGTDPDAGEAQTADRGRRPSGGA